MAGIQTAAYAQNPTRFDMTGRSLTPTLRLTEGKVSGALAQRLARYAAHRLAASGFDVESSRWATLVYTTEANEPPAYRHYTVRYTNESGGYIEVCGIMTRKGWPFLNHGLAIGEE